MKALHLPALIWSLCVAASWARVLRSSGCAVGCSTHGACNEGLCDCSAGYTGNDCSYFLADSGAEDDEDSLDDGDEAETCVDNCSAHGTCGAGICKCDVGWGGLSCNVGAQCAQACKTPNGICKGGSCVCAAGFFGPQCGDSLKQSGVYNSQLQESKNVNIATAHQKELARVRELEKELHEVQQETVRELEKEKAKKAQHKAAQVVAKSVPAKTTKMQANLDAVRHATQQAGKAAEHLRQVAQAEFAKSAKIRVERAIAAAHKQAKDIPGYNADNEDSEDTTIEEPRGFKIEAEASDAFATPGLPGVLSAIVAPTLGMPKCEADCSGHGTCATQGSGTACKCASGWVGMLCDMQRCENDCNGRGMCLQGHCLCGKGFLGETCGTVRCPDDCSGVGFCFHGKCRCKTGYSGASCAKIRPAGLAISVKMQPMALFNAPPPINPNYEGMTLRAVPAKVCPDNCNGHGECGLDGQCSCTVGYSGIACDKFCPNECSHNGECMEGSCLCMAGFMGTDCSMSGCCSGHGSCDNPGTCVCNLGWNGDDCSAKLMCPDPGCSGHGTCSSGTCKCASGFSGPSCAFQSGGCSPPCGNNGACNPVSHKCECAKGAIGPTCMSTLQTSCPKNCNNRGLCMNGMCMCGPGWMGKDCGSKFFAPGQKPPAAAPGMPGAGGAGGAGGGGGGAGGGGGGPGIVGLGGAGGAGEAASGTGGAGGAAGSQGGQGGGGKNLVLASASGGMVCGEGGFCSGHGKCNTGTAKCECAGSFFGAVCERQRCAGFSETGTDCSGHGLCEMGLCQCAPGWGMAPSALVAATRAQSCLDKVCPAGCGMHGKCMNGACVCQQGWQGPNCKDPQCPNDCAGHGQCSFQSVHSPGQCLCNYGWGGAGCQRVAVYAQLKACPNDCAGNGLCMNGMCGCNVGFKGADCSDILCPAGMTGPKCDQPRCPNDCHGQGMCMNGMCACWASFMGKSCKIPVACQETCGALCEAQGKEDKCNSCIGTCESAAPKSNSVFGGPALGAHNPFEDLQSTL